MPIVSCAGAAGGLWSLFVGRAEETDAELEALYAQVPEIGCKGLCTDACGPIEGGHRETVRMRRAGVRLPPRQRAIRLMVETDGNYECPALKNGRCSVYAVRPMVCRTWGASEDMICPYGCEPADGRRRLTSPQTLALIEAARTVGTAERPMTAEQFAAILRTPAGATMYRALVRQPVATRPLPPAAGPGDQSG